MQQHRLLRRPCSPKSSLAPENERTFSDPSNNNNRPGCTKDFSLSWLWTWRWLYFVIVLLALLVWWREYLAERNSFMRAFVWTLAIAAVALAGCNPETPGTIEPEKVVTSMPASLPAGAFQDDAVMATVNGRPIMMAKLNEMLVRDFGWANAQQLVADELVNQLADAKGITVSADDLAVETDSVLRRAMGQNPPPEQRESMVTQLCQQLRITPQVWNMVMHRQALLRKFAAGRVKISDEDIKQEFNDQFGRRVIVRDIQLAKLPDAEKVLAELQSAGDADREQKFGEIASKQSLHPSSKNAGLLQPITASAKVGVPTNVCDAALKLEKKGQLSSIILAESQYHILYLVNAEEPKDVRLEDVKDKLQASIRDKQMETLQQQVLREMTTEAFKTHKIEFVNPILKAKYEEAEKLSKQQPVEVKK
jgi:hypothetical protein